MDEELFKEFLRSAKLDHWGTGHLPKGYTAWIRPSQKGMTVARGGGINIHVNELEKLLGNPVMGKPDSGMPAGALDEVADAFPGFHQNWLNDWLHGTSKKSPIKLLIDRAKGMLTPGAMFESMSKVRGFNNAFMVFPHSKQGVTMDPQLFWEDYQNQLMEALLNNPKTGA